MIDYPAMENHTNCVDLWKLGQSVWNQQLGKIQCIFCCMIMRSCLSTPGPSKYLLPITEAPVATTSPGGLLKSQKPRWRHRCLAHTFTQRLCDHSFPGTLQSHLNLYIQAVTPHMNSGLHMLTLRMASPSKWYRQILCKRWYIHKHPTSSGKKQSNTIENAIATKNWKPTYSCQAPTPSPPTAIQTKPVINDKDQQTREWVEIDISITAQILEMDISEYKVEKQVEMDFSRYKTNKRVEMDISMTTQEPVERVYATDVVFMAVLIMMIQMATILGLTLTKPLKSPCMYRCEITSFWRRGCTTGV